jgi:hypothetical protein
MKCNPVIKQIYCITLVWYSLSLTGCKSDLPTAQEKITTILTHAAGWEKPTVIVDNVDYSDHYGNFEIVFNKTTYSTTAGAPIWNTDGTWKLLDKEATLLEFDDSLQAQITLVSEDLIELEFQWHQNTFKPGRVKSIKGKNKFKLKRKR